MSRDEVIYIGFCAAMLIIVCCWGLGALSSLGGEYTLDIPSPNPQDSQHE